MHPRPISACLIDQVGHVCIWHAGPVASFCAGTFAQDCQRHGEVSLKVCTLYRIADKAQMMQEI